MLHEALMLEIYRQALNAGALPTARPRSTESANSSERCPSHESNSSDIGRDHKEVPNVSGILPTSASASTTFPVVAQNISSQPSSMETYLHMVAAAAQQYGFPLGTAAGSRLPLSLPPAEIHFKLPSQISPTASSNNSEALDFRTNNYERILPDTSEEDEEYEENLDNPLDLSVGSRKRTASSDTNLETNVEQIQMKKVFKSNSPPLNTQHNIPNISSSQMLPAVNPYLAAVAAANIFSAGQFPGWNSKNDLVVDPLEKMSDIVKSQRKEKSTTRSSSATPVSQSMLPSQNAVPSSNPTNLTVQSESVTKTRHNIWQSHWQNKGVASSVFRCVWCKQSFPTLEALTSHMKDSKHCGVNVPPFSNLPSTDRHHQPPPPPSTGQPSSQNAHNLRKHTGTSHNNTSSAAAKAAFQFRGDTPTPLPRKLVRGQNVWLGKGVEQAMQILKCMRCGESFRSLGDMTKHMQETQHYTNILSQEQTLSVKTSSSDVKDQSNLSSEESRTLTAVLTCRVCDKAFNSLGDLSNHMAKNNHYAEPLMQSMGGSGNRKRPAPKKREKSLPVRKLLELKGSQNDELIDAKLQRPYDGTKRIHMDGPGVGPGNDKADAALFAERMRQYITSVKNSEEAKPILSPSNIIGKTKSPDMEQKNGGSKSSSGTSSVLSAIEQMFTTSFDTPQRNGSLPAMSPSNSINSNKNTSPVASNILKRLGIDENVDYNKPLIDTNDPYYQHFRFTSSDRSASECSAEAQSDIQMVETCSSDIPKATFSHLEKETNVELEIMVECESVKKCCKSDTKQKKELRSDVKKEESDIKSSDISDVSISSNLNGNYCSNNNKEENFGDKTCSPVQRTFPPRSPTDSQRSITPKSPASSNKSYDGEKKYPSDSLHALSSMFDSLGNSTSKLLNTRSQSLSNKVESPENLSTSNSLAALRQFCVKKEKTA